MILIHKFQNFQNFIFGASGRFRAQKNSKIFGRLIFFSRGLIFEPPETNPQKSCYTLLRREDGLDKHLWSYQLNSNAGNLFQGTVWYTLFKHEAMIPFMNKFNMTACALGNHEFDDSPDGLLPLAKKAQFPIVCANCDFTEIPEFRGLIKPYQIVEVDGRKIGIIGYLTPNTRNIATTGRMLLRDEVNTLTKVSNQLKGM